MKLVDTAEGRELLAAILIEEGKAAMAKTHLERAQEMEPNRASLKYYLGLVAKEEDPEAAKALFRAYLEAEPRGEHARAARAELRTL